MSSEHKRHPCLAVRGVRSRTGRKFAEVMSRMHVLTPGDVADLEVLDSGHFDDLIAESMTVRVWVSRMTRADGAQYDHGITIERLMPRTGWTRVLEYEPRFPICWRCNEMIESLDPMAIVYVNDVPVCVECYESESGERS